MGHVHIEHAQFWRTLVKFIKSLMFAVAIFASAVAWLAHSAPNVTLNAIMTADRTQSGLVRKSITLDGGEHFVYLEGGQGEPLMLIHGFGANKDAFTRIAKHLTPHYRVIIPDLIGFGESSRPPKADYQPSAQVDRLHRLTAALGIQNGLHIGGNSMGGHISMTWAALHPEEVKSMWLLDPGGVWSGPQSELMKDYAATGKMPLIVTSEDDFIALTKIVMSKPPFAPEFVLRTMAHENIPYQDLMKVILKAIANDPIEPKLQGVKTPTLLVWGDEDRVLSVDSVPILQKLLPQAKVVIMKGIGHLPMMEDVDQTAKDYLAFREQAKI